MRSLSKPEAEQWCIEHGAFLDLRHRPSELGRASSFSIPADDGKHLSLVAQHYAGFAGESETLVVWITTLAIMSGG